MKHPNRAKLALHAGDDLGPFARWRTSRHLAKCGECRAEIAAFDAVRGILPELAAIPEVPWNRLAAAMKANIRLGLAAGEYAGAVDSPRTAPPFAWARAAVAFASVVVLVAAGLVLERTPPRMDIAGRGFQGAELQTTANGIQVSEGGGALGLLHDAAAAKDVNYIAGAQGSMRAQSVDSETGRMMVTNVYAN
jgi:hypothetical protein